MTRWFLVLVAALLCVACPVYEGERVNVAGVELEGMSWRIDCASTTREQLDQRFRDETGGTPAVTRGDWTEIRHPSPVMPGCNELDALESCAAFHRVWRRRMRAQRDLAACGAL